MSNLSFRISPRAAFSCEWNNAIDRNAFYAVKIISSTYAFLKALFFNYTVSKIEVNERFLKEDSDHVNSFFSKEYRKLIDIKSALESSESESSETDLNEGVDRESVRMVWVGKVERLIKNGDFDEADKYLSEENIKLLNPKECRRLFKSTLTLNNDLILSQREIASKLLLTGHCDKLINLFVAREKNPLSFFVSHGIVSGLRYLLKHSAVDVNETDENDYTPLIHAVRGGWVECLRVLLDEGANLNLCSEIGYTALHYAAIDGRVECLIELLNRNGILINMRGDDNFFTPLHISAQMNTPECSKALVLHGAHVNEKDNNGRTPLSLACIEGKCNVVDVLLSSNKALLNHKDYDGCTPLHLAAGEGHKTCVSMLLEKGSVVIDAQDNVGDTSLHRAACNEKAGRCLKMLLTAGAKLNVKNHFNETPLDCANKCKNKECIELLKKAFAHQK